MTAKDYLEQHEIDDITLKVRFKDDRKWGEFTLSELMNQFATHIAERAVKDENEFWLGDSSGLINRTCNNILFRIKKLTNDK